MEGIIQCAQRHEVNITVLSAFGHVSNVTLRVLNFPLEGPFHMLDTQSVVQCE
jgi:predicted DNA-binding protein with PD1-like motif